MSYIHCIYNFMFSIFSLNMCAAEKRIRILSDPKFRSEMRISDPQISDPRILDPKFWISDPISVFRISDPISIFRISDLGSDFISDYSGKRTLYFILYTRSLHRGFYGKRNVISDPKFRFRDPFFGSGSKKIIRDPDFGSGSEKNIRDPDFETSGF